MQNSNTNITIGNLLCKLFCIFVLLFMASKLSVIYYFRDIAIPYRPVALGSIVYYEKTNDSLGIDKDTFIEKMEQYFWNNESTLLSKDILNLQENFNEVSYCVMANGSHYSYRVNALYNVNTKRIQQITVYSYGNEVWDFNSHLCLKYIWTCINTDAVSEENKKYLDDIYFYFNGSKTINGIVYERMPLRSTRYKKYPETFIFHIDITNVKESMNSSYMVTNDEE